MLRTLFYALILLGSLRTASAETLEEPSVPVALRSISSSSGWRVWLRKRVSYQADWQKYGLSMDQGWEQARLDSPVVVLVHGFNSRPSATESLILPARDADMPCGVFAYPNDQPIASSAELLSRELSAFAKEHPERRVALVTHSMGGLVARACVEDPKLNPNMVDRLIMVSPPTHGSELARWAVGLDLWEHWISRRDGSPWRRTRDSFVDGLSEAPTDLRPGSIFLQQLNACGLNPKVRYTILLGSRAKVSESQRFMLQKSILSASDIAPGWEVTASEVQRIVGKLDEVVDGRGDGAVAICRGRLDGVADTHVLPFSHLSVVERNADPAADKARRLILERLTCTAEL